jgi:putative transposase
MSDRAHELSISCLAKAPGISRGNIYHLPQPTSEADLGLIRRIDESYLEHPFADNRTLKGLLNGDGHKAGRCHIGTLMKRMGIEALYRCPNTSKPAPGYKIYPYLLRNLPVVRPDQVWATDITYISMAHGFLYLSAVVDWFSRKILARKLSITLLADFRIETLQETLARDGRPDIANSDQGSQFTSAESIKALKGERRPLPVRGRRRTRSSSAWTARAPGATTSSSSASGGR